MLRDQCTHSQAAVTSAEKRQLVWSRPFLLNQVFRRRREIIEHVLFLREIPGLVPLLAELATAANVGDHINTTAIEPNAAREIKIRGHADSVTAIAVEQGGIIPVLLCSLFANDV